MKRVLPRARGRWPRGPEGAYRGREVCKQAIADTSNFKQIPPTMPGLQKSRREFLTDVQVYLRRLAPPMSDREIWFRRFGVGYRPRHGKGWAFVLGMIGLVAAINELAFNLAPPLIGLTAIVTVPIAIFSWVFVERHREAKESI